MASESKDIQRREGSRWMNPFDEMARTFDQFLQGRWMKPFWQNDERTSQMPMPFEGHSPRVDLIDQGETLMMRAEMPGIKKDDIKLTVTEDSIMLRGETKTERKEEKEGNYYRREMSYGSFARTLPLPTTVDPEQAKASFKDGVLEVTLRKTNSTPRREISID